MLNLSNIEKYYSLRERAFKRNILREYLQCKILEIIFNSPQGKKLAFLGGTALRLIYGNSRFSEDLDFDNFGINEKDFSLLADRIRQGLEAQGCRVEIKNVFKGAYRSYIKMPEILFDNDLSDLREEKIMIQLDTVPRVFDYKKDLKIINKFDVFTQINVAPIDLLLAQKIYAAVNRKRAKGRDFFDIVFLLPLTPPNYQYLGAKLGIKNGEQLKKVLLSKTKDLNFNELAKDVAPFVVNGADAKKITMFREYIQSFKF